MISMSKPNKNGVMRPSLSAPPEWVCNARASHKGTLVGGHVGDTVSEDIPDKCYCANCLMDEDPRLLKGSPQPTELFTAEQLEKSGYVGMYARKPDFYVPCGECHQGIPVSVAAHVAAARSGEFVLLHYSCLPEEKRKMTLVAPYVLMRVEEEGSEDGAETGAEGIRGEDGEGAEGERAQGDLGGQGPGDDGGEAVG